MDHEAKLRDELLRAAAMEKERVKLLNEIFQLQHALRHIVVMVDADKMREEAINVLKQLYE